MKNLDKARCLGCLGLIAAGCLIMPGCATIACGIGGPEAVAYEAPPDAPKLSLPSRDLCADFSPFPGAIIQYDQARRCWWAPEPSGLELDPAGKAILFPPAGVEPGAAAWVDGTDLAVSCDDTIKLLPLDQVRVIVGRRP